MLLAGVYLLLRRRRRRLSPEAKEGSNTAGSEMKYEQAHVHEEAFQQRFGCTKRTENNTPGAYL